MLLFWTEGETLKIKGKKDGECLLWLVEGQRGKAANSDVASLQWNKVSCKSFMFTDRSVGGGGCWWGSWITPVSIGVLLSIDFHLLCTPSLPDFVFNRIIPPTPSPGVVTTSSLPDRKCPIGDFGNGWFSSTIADDSNAYRLSEL